MMYLLHFGKIFQIQAVQYVDDTVLVTYIDPSKTGEGAFAKLRTLSMNPNEFKERVNFKLPVKEF